ncbi:hypothetical protein RBH20_09730 [Haloarcula sp. H-GB4]|uniref:hypothetical protein n=1 Tax=Haloarcula sp. H-GB4 TaxID=3069755 RepID=UPI0027B7B949|nr:hypothetical protein [Haloarcula sp. H-GB4]MDQ2072813.1 hypothetical protein [Haloarcula sp. H-GB4]
MTRRSRRELERAVDELDGQRSFTVADFMWADLKDYHGGRLTPAERRLLQDPEDHLTPAAQTQVDTEER